MSTEESLAIVIRVRNAIGRPVHLKPFERALKASISDRSVSLLVETFRVADGVRRQKITARGKRLITWDAEGAGWDTIWKQTEMTMWDENFEPEEVVKWGNVSTPEELRERRAFERDCYRPGNAAAPLDTYGRVLLDPTTPAMERHFQ